MRRTAISVALALVVAVGTASRAAAGIPHYVSVQGVLTDASEQPIDGNRNMTFRIYDVSSGGSAIWSETQSVTIDQGRYSVLLGTVTALDLPFDKDYWLSIEVASDGEMTPRYRVASSPYAYNADTVDGLHAADLTGGAGDGHSLDAVDGDPVDAIFVDNDGKVGVGTTTPTRSLDVSGKARIGGELKVPSVTGGGQCSITFMTTTPSANTPVDIPDNNPIGVTDSTTVPDLGAADRLIVSIDITNSDLSTLQVYLYDPNTVEYVLYDKGTTGTSLLASYPEPTSTVSGDLNTWIGQNAQGTWTLKVVDTGFLNNGIDGQINSWSIAVQATSASTARVKDGNLKVDGELLANGGIGFSDGSSMRSASGVVLVYSGSDIDTWASSAGPTLDEKSYELSPIPAREKKYVLVCMAGLAGVRGGTTSGSGDGTQSLAIDIKHNGAGGVYYAMMSYRTVQYVRGEEGRTHVRTGTTTRWLHALTDEEKANGFTLRLWSKSSAPDDSIASYTHWQTIVMLLD